MSYDHYLQGKAIRTGCDWALRITVVSSALEPFPANAQFKAHVRNTVDGPLLVELTTAGGGVVRRSNTEIELRIPGSVSKEWKDGSVVMDVIRTDALNPVHLGFDLEIPVKRSVTRL